MAGEGNTSSVRKALAEFLGRRKPVVEQALAAIEAQEAQIRDRRARRAAILGAPANKTELKNAVGRWLGNGSADLHAEMVQRLQALARTPSALSHEPAVRSHLGIAGHPSRYGESAPVGLVDAVLIALAGPAVAEAMNRAIDALDLPTDSLPWAEREAAVKALDDEIAALQADLDALVRDADAAGFLN